MASSFRAFFRDARRLLWGHLVSACELVEIVGVGALFRERERQKEHKGRKRVPEDLSLGPREVWRKNTGGRDGEGRAVSRCKCWGAAWARTEVTRRGQSVISGLLGTTHAWEWRSLIRFGAAWPLFITARGRSDLRYSVIWTRAVQILVGPRARIWCRTHPISAEFWPNPGATPPAFRCR